MSSINYGGIDLEIINTRNCAREAVATPNGANYQMTRFVLDADFVVNPQATSYRPRNAGIFAGILNAANQNPPVKQKGLLPALTDVAIRDRLLQRRLQLTYKDDQGNVILSAPTAGYSADAHNGPYAEDVRVWRVIGSRTWNVSARFIAHINERPKFSGLARLVGPPDGFPIVLSHVWRQTGDMDEDYFLRVITEGTATLRTDELLKRGTFPDQYRAALAHAIAPGFKRESVQVVATDDPNTLAYRVVDRELAFSTPAVHKCTRVRAWHDEEVREPSFWVDLIDGGFAQITSLASSINSLGMSVLGGGVMSMTGAAANAGLQIQGQVAATIARMFPTWISTCIVECWGSNESRRRTLQDLAVSIGIIRVGEPSRGAAFHAKITHDVAGKYVRLMMQHVRKLTPQALNQLAPAAGFAGASAWNVLRAQFPPLFEQTGVYLRSAPANNYAPPNSLGMRGTSVRQIMAQTLWSGNQQPPSPVLRNNLDADVP